MNPSMNSCDTLITVPDHEHQTADRSDQANLPLLSHQSETTKSAISDELQSFRVSLQWCALDHSAGTGKFISYTLFILLTIVVPILSSLSYKVPASAPDEDPISFNKLVHIPESGLATIAFVTLSKFFKRYSLRQLLFLDVLEEDTFYVQRGYTRELDRAFRYLAFILLPSFCVELAHKIVFFSAVVVSIPYLGKGFPVNSIMFLLVLGSWVYRTGMFLLVCVLFRLTCELQILRFEGFRDNFLEGPGSDAGLIFDEHLRIRKQLSVTSHRYRFFIIGCLVTITVCQFWALLLALGSKAQKSFFNSGDIVVCSAVQISGFFLCLMGAARITHRAQGIVSVASRWHMLVTSASNSSSASPYQQKGATMMAAVDHMQVAKQYCCNGVPESSENIFCSQDPSSFQTRQALVSYLRHNNGGITVYGYALDRGLLHTLFAFETSLVLWILSKVVVLT